MACLDNLQIVQTISYSVAPNMPQGYVLGQISIELLNTGLLPIDGTLTIDRTRDLPVIDLEDSPIAQVENINSTGETFNSYFYYPVSKPTSITINAAVDVRIGDCLYRAECNHVLLTPNEGEEQSSCTVDVQGYAVVSGCTNPLYYEYNANANVDDGSCATLIPILGCTNPLAYNYNPLATKNDGSCIFTSGCTNPIANNYDESAVIDDGSCECADISIQLNIVEASGQSIVIEPNCDYVIEFDLFTRINCASFLSYFERSDQTVLDILNSLKINTQIYTLLDEEGNSIEYSGGTIDLSGTSYALIQNENIYSFDISKSPVGLGLDDSNSTYCETFFDLIATEQGLECQSFDKTKFDINWQHYSFALNSDLANTFTKFVLNFENFKFGICTYIDNLKVSKVCTTDYTKCVLIPSRYGFDLERVIDNKKSWLVTDTTTTRTYSYEHRETDYLDYDSRLIFNTKELELQINPVKYIQSDVVDFFNYYEKFYTDDSKTQTLTLDKIENEYIDVKNRQTIRSYSYLPNLYQKYLLGLDCANSKRLHYDYVFDILERTGTLWHQMISQLVPATSIWQGNQYILKNTVFDSQKFSYKRYSLDDGTGASDGNCAPSGVTIECQTISDKCFDTPFESIDDLLISGTSDIICEKTGDTVCFSEFIGDGSFSGRLIQYFDLSGDSIDVLNLYGYQNYNCFSGITFEPLNVNVTYICSGFTAQLVIGVAGGVPPYTITGNQNGQFLPINTPYFVTVTDSVGNSSGLLTGLLVCPPPIGNCDEVNVIISADYTCVFDECNNLDGTAVLNLSAVGGTAPYTYFDMVSLLTVANGDIVTDNQNLNILAFDANGCVSLSPVSLSIDCVPCPMTHEENNPLFLFGVQTRTDGTNSDYVFDYHMSFFGGCITCINVTQLNPDINIIAGMPIICSSNPISIGNALTVVGGVIPNRAFVYRITIEFCNGCTYVGYASHVVVGDVANSGDVTYFGSDVNVPNVPTPSPMTLLCATDDIEVSANYECSVNSCGYNNGQGILILNGTGGVAPYTFYDTITETEVFDGDTVVDGQQINVIAYDANGYVSNNIVQLTIDCEESPCSAHPLDISLRTRIIHLFNSGLDGKYHLDYDLFIPLGTTLSTLTYTITPDVGVITSTNPIVRTTLSGVGINITNDYSPSTPSATVFDIMAVIILTDGCEYNLSFQLSVDPTLLGDNDEVTLSPDICI